jgi:hypothetical protein
VPLDARVEVRFDRYLLPKTAVRQSLRVYSGGRNNALFLAPTYDPLERVVIFQPAYGAALQPGLLYQVSIVVPAQDPDGLGFRAFDGAPLEVGGVPLHFSFVTARAAESAPDAGAPRDAGAPAPTAPEPRAPCADVLDVLGGGCGDCHSGPDARAGLKLYPAADLAATAVHQVAHETDLGAASGRVLVDPQRFGVGMARVDPTSPGTSYLIYKLLVNPWNFGPDPASCGTAYRVALPEGACLLAPRAERDRLRDWFVAGDPMPSVPPGPAQPGDPAHIDVAGIRRLQAFIQAGASTSGCP